jgi:hypothetical protein
MAGRAAAIGLAVFVAAGTSRAGRQSPPMAGTVAPPPVAVWYRGVPAGVPRQNDLAAIRALGFSAIAWPADFGAALSDVTRMAAVADLQVEVRASPHALTAEGAFAPPMSIDVSVAPAAVPTFTALTWRAVAHGARRVAFDAGSPTGAGLDDANAAWVRPAASLARQLASNTTLFAALRDMPPLVVESPPNSRLDVVLRQTDRAWVLIATNLGPAPQRVVARLPAEVPSALWVSLMDGDAMSMLSLPGGPRWTVDLAAGEARAYVIDKVRRGQTGVSPRTPGV